MSEFDGVSPTGDGDTPAPRRVLVADAGTDLRQLLRVILEGAGCTVIEAATVRATLREYRRHQPDALIVDLNLPEQGGLFLLDAIRHERVDRPTRAILLSAEESVDLRHLAIDHQIDDIVLKPFRPSRLIASLRTLSYPASADSRRESSPAERTGNRRTADRSVETDQFIDFPVERIARRRRRR